MAVLSRDAILQADDRKQEEVEVPEWGGSVIIRCMTGKERDEFESETYQQKGKDIEYNRRNFRARLLVRTLVDYEGKPIFSSKEADALGEKSGIVLDRILTNALRINGLGKDEVENLTKN